MHGCAGYEPFGRGGGLAGKGGANTASQTYIKYLMSLEVDPANENRTFIAADETAALPFGMCV